MLANLARQLLYPRFLITRPRAEPQHPRLERHYLSTSAGEIEYWFIPASEEATQGQPAPVALFAHGNGELIDDWVEPFATYGQLGVHLLLVEYRGYGRSPGKPSATALIDDFCHVAAWARLHPLVDSRRLIYHGRSIGGGVACGATRRLAPAALVLESTFTDLATVVERFGLPSRWLPDHYDNLDTVRSFQGPCLVFHGTADRTIPLQHGQTLSEAGLSTRFVPFKGAGHNTPLTEQVAYWDGLRWLLAALRN